jgi:glycosyltransferase involved in cell wall biosynthesis
MHPGIPHSHTADVYASHDIYVNLTRSGSFDKTIGEAAASGCILVVANAALRGVVPDDMIVEPDESESVVRGLTAALALSDEERMLLRGRLRAYIEREHSLIELVRRLTSIVAV